MVCVPGRPAQKWKWHIDVDDLASLSLSLPSDGTDASADEQALSLLAAAGDKINGKANAKAKGGKNKRWVPSACMVCGIKHDDMPIGSTYCHAHKQASLLAYSIRV